MSPVQIPRLDAPDAVFSWSVVSLSLRQFALILLGSVGAVNVWSLLGTVGLGDAREILALITVVVFVTMIVLFGWVRVGGQHFEYYLVARMRYYVCPRIAVWTAAR
jgi:hypothetical protein